MLIAKNIKNKTMYNMRELHLSLFLATIFTSSIIIEIQLRVVVLAKLDRIFNQLKIFFLRNPNIFMRITLHYFSSSNIYECLKYCNCNSIIINGKIINITIKSSFFHSIYWPIFWDVSKTMEMLLFQSLLF